MRYILSSALLAIAVAGCGPVNRGMTSANQPVVNRADYVLDVAAAGLVSPNTSDAQRLDAWFDALGLRYGDKVTVDDASGYGGQDARDTVAALLARRGLLIGGTAPVTAGTVEPGAVRVVVSRTDAKVPDCPNWDRPSQPDFATSGMSNYGCAVNSNLAAMIADPMDLVEGRAARDVDTQTVNKAITSYRNAKPTAEDGLKKETN
jgi:pilus assembly protein CpaD